MDRNRLIGAGDGLPWRLPADMKYFKSVTMGKPVIMGRKTYETIGKPLKGRHNIVLTRDVAYRAPGCTVVHSPQAALLAAGDAAEVMIIGGAEVYRRFLPKADRLYLTCIEAEFDGDTYFPQIASEHWQTVWEERHDADEQNPHPFRFTILERGDGATRKAAVKQPE
jgi:dihydrofolate reductase